MFESQYYFYSAELRFYVDITIAKPFSELKQRRSGHVPTFRFYLLGLLRQTKTVEMTQNGFSLQNDEK